MNIPTIRQEMSSMQTIAHYDIDNQLFDLSTELATQLMHCRDVKHLDLAELRKLASDWHQLALVKTDPRRG